MLKLVAGALAPVAGCTLPAAARAQSAQPSSPPVNLLEFEPLARQRLSRPVWDYVAQGAADEITLRRNREAFDSIRLKPHVLNDVSALDTRLELFGRKLEFPILLAPVAAQGRIHAGAEPEAARGASAAGATMVVSTFASARLEDIARAAQGRVWFQLYVHRVRAVTRDLIQRAEAAGCAVLCITVDTPVVPMRDREKRLAVSRPYTGPFSAGRVSPIYADSLDPTVTWETIAWIRSFAKTPVLLKGILAPEDARRAATEGLAGVVVSCDDRSASGRGRGRSGAHDDPRRRGCPPGDRCRQSPGARGPSGPDRAAILVGSRRGRRGRRPASDRDLARRARGRHGSVRRDEPRPDQS